MAVEAESSESTSQSSSWLLRGKPQHHRLRPLLHDETQVFEADHMPQVIEHRGTKVLGNQQLHPSLTSMASNILSCWWGSARRSNSTLGLMRYLAWGRGSKGVGQGDPLGRGRALSGRAAHPN